MQSKYLATSYVNCYLKSSQYTLQQWTHLSSKFIGPFPAKLVSEVLLQFSRLEGTKLKYGNIIIGAWKFSDKTYR